MNTRFYYDFKLWRPAPYLIYEDPYPQKNSISLPTTPLFVTKSLSNKFIFNFKSTILAEEQSADQYNSPIVNSIKTVVFLLYKTDFLTKLQLFIPITHTLIPMKSELLQSNLILENEKVLLIPFENERNLELKAIIFDDTIWKYMGMYVRNDLDFENYIQNTLQQKANGICYPFLIIDKATNQVAGSTRYGYLNAASQKCEIGWTWYGKAFQGTGLNKACKFALLDFGFENIQFKRIQFSADLENTKSQRAIEKLGALKEGVFRNNYIDSQGNSKDDVYYSIISEQWAQTKQAYFSEFRP